jgi:hypothetical protein
MNVRCCAIGFLGLALASGCAQTPGRGFEGEIDMTSSGAGAPTVHVRYFIKGERVRIETSVGSVGTTTIMDISTNDVFMLDDAKKTYRTMSVAPPAASTSTTTTTHVAAPAMHRLASRTATVAGIPCAVQSTPIPTGHVETCTADGLDLPSRAWASVFGAAGSGAFVLRREVFDSSGTRVVWLETSRVEHAKEPATLFAAPPGYALVR